MKQMLITFIYMLKMLMKQNNNFHLTNKKVQTKRFSMSLKSLLLSNNIDGICKNIEEYNPNNKRKILIAFDDIIADMLNNKKLKT